MGQCARGYYCAPIVGNPNTEGQCLPEKSEPETATCWMGPSCDVKASGIDFSSNYAMISNNCFDDQQMCKNHNQEAAPPAQSYCYSNKGGMCVTLQQSPGYYGAVSGECYSTQRECKQSIDTAPPTPAPTTPTCYPANNPTCSYSVVDTGLVRNCYTSQDECLRHFCPGAVLLLLQQGWYVCDFAAIAGLLWCCEWRVLLHATRVQMEHVMKLPCAYMHVVDIDNCDCSVMCDQTITTKTTRTNNK